MKTIIDRVLYNTDNSTLICTIELSSFVQSSYRTFFKCVYRTKNNRYFLYQYSLTDPSLFQRYILRRSPEKYGEHIYSLDTFWLQALLLTFDKFDIYSTIFGTNIEPSTVDYLVDHGMGEIILNKFPGSITEG